jgi:hypothetical protein
MTAKIEKPEPIKYTISDDDKYAPGREITIETPSDIKAIQGQRCLNGGTVHRGGKTHPLYILIDNKPALAAKINQWIAEWNAYDTAKAAEFDRNVPGYDELKDALAVAEKEEYRYHKQFNAMMENEYNDGAFPPTKLNTSLREKASALTSQYPRAAIYIKAENFTYSNNNYKFSAGRAAKELIAEGGSLTEAKEILNNWLPKEAMWN